MFFVRICVEIGMGTVLPTKIRLNSVRTSPIKEDTPVEVKVVYQWKPLRCSSCKKFGHGTTQCKPQIVKPPDRILEVVPASVDQTVSNRTLATSRQRSSLRAPPQSLEGPDIALIKDLEKIAYSEIPNPPVPSSNSFAILLEVDSSVNQTKRMVFGNEGCHNMDRGSKRNTTDQPLPEATFPCVAPQATKGEIYAVYSGAAFSSDTLAGDEAYGPNPVLVDSGRVHTVVLPDAPRKMQVHSESVSPQLMAGSLMTASGQAEADEEEFHDLTFNALKLLLEANVAQTYLDSLTPESRQIVSDFMETCLLAETIETRPEFNCSSPLAEADQDSSSDTVFEAIRMLVVAKTTQPYIASLSPDGKNAI